MKNNLFFYFVLHRMVQWSQLHFFRLIPKDFPPEIPILGMILLIAMTVRSSFGPFVVWSVRRPSHTGEVVVVFFIIIRPCSFRVAIHAPYEPAALLFSNLILSHYASIPLLKENPFVKNPIKRVINRFSSFFVIRKQKLRKSNEKNLNSAEQKRKSFY